MARAEAATSAAAQQEPSPARTHPAVDHTPSHGRSPMHAEELRLLRAPSPFLRLHRLCLLRHLIVPPHVPRLLPPELRLLTPTVSHVHATSAAAQREPSPARTHHAVDHTPS